MNVFVSWRGCDRDIKNQIVEALRAELKEDDEVWESDEGCTSGFSADCINAIRSSQVFVVILSDEAMEPSYVRNEVVEARSLEDRGELNIVMYKITDSELTPEFAGYLNHISDANRVARLTGSDSGITTLVKRVRHLLFLRKSGTPEKPMDVYMPVISGITVKNTGYFVPGSRDDVFSELDEAFSHSNAVFAAQLSGYGRKSAVRRYAEMHAGQYRTIVQLHLFSGSLYDLFLNGIEISNINSSVFDNLDNAHVIARKAEILKKLGSDTLIIVPGVVPGSNDNGDILNLIAQLSCRFIFICEGVPKRLKDAFPVVDIGRLEDCYLRELFFNYYDSPDEDERELLLPALDTFFDSVDGHTKSVEITANVLADEIGIYPEDLPRILGNIRPGTNNRLADRIFSLISDMFEMKQFSETEKQLLLISALIADRPLDEKVFVDLLRACGIEDFSNEFRTLSERCWLDRDRSARTIAVDPLIASVCLAKLQADDKLVTDMYCWLADLLFDNIRNSKVVTTLDLAARLARFCSFTKLKPAAQAYGLFSMLLKDMLFMEPPEEINRINDEVTAFIASVEDERLRDRLDDSLSFILQQAKAFTALSNITERGKDESFAKAYALTLFDKDTTEVIDDFSEYLADYNGALGDLFLALSNACAQGNPVSAALQLISIFEMLTESYSSGDYEENRLFSDSEDLETALEILVMCSRMILLMIRDNPYMTVKFCRTYFAACSLFNYSLPASDRFLIHKQLLQAYCQIGDFGPEADSCLDSLLSTFSVAENDLFPNPADADASISDSICSYCIALADNGHPERAAKVFSHTGSLPYSCATDVSSRLEAVSAIARGYIREGNVTAAADLIADAITPGLSAAADRYAEAGEQGSFSLAGELIEIRTALLESETADVFSDMSATYSDYYHTYAASSGSRRDYIKYTEIAHKAMEADLSSLSADELRETAEVLKNKAAGTKHWENIAPAAFALVSEAGFRVLGYRHHLVQYIGAAAIFDGKIAEIQNGEGKTYTIILAAFLHYIFGRQAHIIDDNAYLAKRNFGWMRGVLELLGCDVRFLDSTLICGTREDRDSAFNGYLSCDMIYSSVAEEIWALRNTEMHLYPRRRKLRYEVMIADEADSLLITNGTMGFNTVREGYGAGMRRMYFNTVYEFVSSLPDADFERCCTYIAVSESVTVNTELMQRFEEFFNTRFDSDFNALSIDISTELRDALKMAILACRYYTRGEQYHVADNRIVFENKATGTYFTGRLDLTYFLGMHEGLHHYVNSLDLSYKITTDHMAVRAFATYFDMLSGTSATASSFKKELKDFYGLEVISIPTNIPISRVDNVPMIITGTNFKYRHILELVREKHATGQPILVITGSVGDSELVYGYFTRCGLTCTLLNANCSAEEEADRIGSAGRINAITVANAKANRGVDIMLGGDPGLLARQDMLAEGYTLDDINAAIYGSKDADRDAAWTAARYRMLSARYRQTTDAEKAQVIALGGLCVIGTECFDSLATEQQVRGRCGRQGSVGESYIFYSLEDHSIQTIMGDHYDFLRNMLNSLDLTDYASSELGQPAIIVRSVRKGREKLQNMLYSSLNEMPELRYYQDAREKILCFAQRELYGNFERAARSLSERYLPGSGISPDAVERLRQAFAGPDHELFLIFLQKALNSAWENYLFVMKEEIASVSQLYSGNPNKIKNHLSSISVSLSDRALKDAFISACRMMLKNQ